MFDWKMQPDNEHEFYWIYDCEAEDEDEKWGLAQRSANTWWITGYPDAWGPDNLPTLLWLPIEHTITPPPDALQAKARQRAEKFYGEDDETRNV